MSTLKTVRIYRIEQHKHRVFFFHAKLTLLAVTFLLKSFYMIKKI